MIDGERAIKPSDWLYLDDDYWIDRYSTAVLIYRPASSFLELLDAVPGQHDPAAMTSVLMVGHHKQDKLWNVAMISLTMIELVRLRAGIDRVLAPVIRQGTQP